MEEDGDSEGGLPGTPQGEISRRAVKRAKQKLSKQKRLEKEASTGGLAEPDAAMINCTSCNEPTTMLDSVATGGRNPLKRDCKDCVNTKSWLRRKVQGRKDKRPKAPGSGKKRRRGGGGGGGRSSSDSDGGGPGGGMKAPSEEAKKLKNIDKWLKDKDTPVEEKIKWYQAQKRKTVEEGSRDRRSLQEVKGSLEQSERRSREVIMKHGFVGYETWAAPKFSCKIFTEKEEGEAA